MCVFLRVWILGCLIGVSNLATPQGPHSLWAKTYGGDTLDVGHSVQQISDSGYIIAGYTHSFGAGEWDTYLIRTEPDVGIEENAKIKAQNAKLEVCPNPFAYLTKISYRLSKTQQVSLQIYDISGRIVKEVLNCEQKAGCYTIEWSGEEIDKTGIYFLRLKTGNQKATKKLIKINL